MMKNQNLISQAAAIPWKKTGKGEVKVLLIRWSTDDKWGIPKGRVDLGTDHRYTAANEALEEGGVEGSLSKQPVGTFTYEKARGAECLVEVFSLEVTQEHESYLEASHRIREWFEIHKAAEMVSRKQVKRLILQLSGELKK